MHEKSIAILMDAKQRLLDELEMARAISRQREEDAHDARRHLGRLEVDTPSKVADINALLAVLAPEPSSDKTEHAAALKRLADGIPAQVAN